MKKTRTQKHYSNIVVEDLLLMYNYQNIMELPKMNRAILSTSSKSSLFDKQVLINGVATCLLLSGQRSALTRARKSVAAFQLRKGSIMGCMVTIRGDKMYALLDKVVSFVLPRLQGQSIEHRANTSFSTYRIQSGSDWLKREEQRDVNFGTSEATLFPEIESLFGGGSSLRKKAVVTIPTVDGLSAISLAEGSLPIQRHKASVALDRRARYNIHQYGAQEVSKSSALVSPVRKQTFNALQGLNISFSFCTHKSHLRRSFVGDGKVCTNRRINYSNTQNRSNRISLATKAQFEEMSQACPLFPIGGSGATADIRIEKRKDLLFLSAFQYPVHY